MQAIAERRPAAAGQVVDLAFRVRGATVAVDHGYALLGAISRVWPEVHGDEAIGVHPIGGRLVGERRLALTEGSRLTLRLPAARIAEALRLAGQRLEVDGSMLAVGVPTVRTLRPATTLLSRLVVIKGFMEPGVFLEAARRQAVAFGIGGRLALVARSFPGAVEGRTARAAGEPIRRTLRIRDKTVVGFALAATELSAEESLRLQEAGLGGRRRFGCGVFVPPPRREA